MSLAWQSQAATVHCSWFRLSKFCHYYCISPVFKACHQLTDPNSALGSISVHSLLPALNSITSQYSCSYKWQYKALLICCKTDRTVICTCQNLNFVGSLPPHQPGGSFAHKTTPIVCSTLPDIIFWVENCKFDQILTFGLLYPSGPAR